MSCPGVGDYKSYSEMTFGDQLFFSAVLSLCVSSRCLAKKIAGVCLEMAGACYDSAVLMGATPSFLFMEC